MTTFRPPTTPVLPVPAAEPARSVWDRKSWRGALPVNNVSSIPIIVGTVEHHVTLATNMDVFIDLTGALIGGAPIGTAFAILNAAIYVQESNQKVYVSQWQFALNPGPNTPTKNNFPAAVVPGDGGASLNSGFAWLVLGSAVASGVWGLELSAPGGTGLSQITNIFVGSICHGVEI